MEVLVAISAGGVDRLVMSFGMAACARDLLMLALQFEATHLVVEERDSPAREARVTLVTGLLLELVSMGCRVTEATVCVGVVIPLCSRWVAAVTWLLLMTPAQIKAGHAVVKLGLRPALRAVALTTRCVLEGVTVGILGFVATSALRCDRLVASIWVTLRALNATMLPNQRESTHLVMIESKVAPGEARLTVTRTTALPLELSSMVVLVTGRTVGTAGLPLCPLVAIEALILSVLTPYWPTCRSVVKGRAALKAGRQMALLADSSAEYAFRVWVLVTCHTPLDLDGAKLPFAEVTLLTGKLLVKPGKRKDGLLGMIEVEPPFESLPIGSRVTALAGVQITLSRFAVIAAVTALTCVRRV